MSHIVQHCGHATDQAQLSTAQRQRLCADFDRDGYVVLPCRLPTDLNQRCIDAIDRISQQRRTADPELNAVKIQGCVDHDPSFIELMFTLVCSSPTTCWVRSSSARRTASADPLDGTRSRFEPTDDWRADGPRPGLFPRVAGAMGLHYLKFGFFTEVCPPMVTTADHPWLTSAG